MDLKHVIARDEKNKSVTMRLYGAIGDQIDGHQFAREIVYLSEVYDNIEIKVNSEGGSVLQGISIFNAILNSTATVTVCIEGLAASMGGFLCFAADKITMNDFARLMIHDPYNPEKETNKMTPKEKRGIESFTGMLAEITAIRCGDKEKAAAYMKAETWFTAEEAKAAGLIDEIIVTGKAQSVAAQISGIAALTSNTFTNFLQPKQENMKLIAALYGLGPEATEAEIIAKINAERATAAAVATERDTVKAERDTLQAAATASIDAEVNALADRAIETGNFKAEMKADLVAMGKANPDTFKKMIEGLQPVTASVVDAVVAASVNGTPAGGKTTDADEFERLRREDPNALVEMKVSENARFKKLEAAWEKKFC